MRWPDASIIFYIPWPEQKPVDHRNMSIFEPCPLLLLEHRVTNSCFQFNLPETTTLCLNFAFDYRWNFCEKQT